jgi:hypothetical protein
MRKGLSSGLFCYRRSEKAGVLRHADGIPNLNHHIDIIFVLILYLIPLSRGSFPRARGRGEGKSAGESADTRIFSVATRGKSERNLKHKDLNKPCTRTFRHISMIQK